MRTLTRAVPALACATLLLGGYPGPARADGDRLLVSRDGESWASTISTPLFQPAVLAPRDRLVEVLHLRNGSTDRAAAWLYLLDTSASPWLAEHLRVSARRADTGDATGDGTSAPPTTLANATSPLLLLGPHELRAGESVAVQLALALDDVAGGVGQGGAAGFELVVRLTEPPETPGALGAPVAPGAPEAPAVPAPPPATAPSPAPARPGPAEPGRGPGAPGQVHPDVAVIRGLGSKSPANDRPETTGSRPEDEYGGTAGTTTGGAALGVGAVAITIALLARSRRRRRDA
jgi:hypothetical protein